jgi:hypothetical protein
MALSYASFVFSLGDPDRLVEVEVLDKVGVRIIVAHGTVRVRRAVGVVRVVRVVEMFVIVVIRMRNRDVAMVPVGDIVFVYVVAVGMNVRMGSRVFVGDVAVGIHVVVEVRILMNDVIVVEVIIVVPVSVRGRSVAMGVV